MASWDIFRILIRAYKDSDLNSESFSDAIDEFSSDDTEKIYLALGLSKYIENLEFYNFSDVKALSDLDRDYVSALIIQLIQEYLAEHNYSAEWSNSLDGPNDDDDEIVWHTHCKKTWKFC